EIVLFFLFSGCLCIDKSYEVPNPIEITYREAGETAPHGDMERLYGITSTRPGTSSYGTAFYDGDE
ncbi:hypothetical protein, partial [Escherichia coli]|uniref:hypothetical protein n=1 Tax=Escherichia coli TaxID=562 RepID=UPI001BC8C1AB